VHITAIDAAAYALLPPLRCRRFSLLSVDSVIFSLERLPFSRACFMLRYFFADASAASPLAAWPLIFSGAPCFAIIYDAADCRQIAPLPMLSLRFRCCRLALARLRYTCALLWLHTRCHYARYARRALLCVEMLLSCCAALICYADIDTMLLRDRRRGRGWQHEYVGHTESLYHIDAATTISFTVARYHRLGGTTLQQSSEHYTARLLLLMIIFFDYFRLRCHAFAGFCHALLRLPALPLFTTPPRCRHAATLAYAAATPLRCCRLCRLLLRIRRLRFRCCFDAAADTPITLFSLYAFRLRRHFAAYF